MRNQFLSLVIIALVISFQSCQNSPEAEEQALKSYVGSADTGVMTGSDFEDLTSDSRKVIRKADIRCRVKNVQEAVGKLEAFTTMAGGFVQESHTKNQVVSEKSTPYMGDSVKTAQVYNTTANLVIRIPYYALDTLATEITNVAAFIDHRDMTRDDVTLQFISNVLKNREAVKTAATAEKQKATADKKTEVLQYKDDNASQQVDRRIANLSILDDSRYATLSLELYQPQQATVFVTQDVDKLIAPSYGEKIADAMAGSIEIIKGFTLIIITTWPVWIAAIAIIIYFKRSARKRKYIAPVV